MRDTVYTGVVAGTAGGLSKLAVNLLLYWAGAAKTTSLHFAAAALLPPNVPLNTLPALLVGFAVDWLTAVLGGLAGVYFLRATGWDFLYLKGIVFGGLLWLVGYGFLAQMVVPERLLRPDVGTSATLLVGHLVFGLVLFTVAARLKTGEVQR
ncbi:hypothetical protein EDD75_1941 [Thermodesulfitimonas autotrophica]|uniref:Membrane protein YqhR n=1 Tax=Thermodesulfitimonas autotrophica TaxID=1894989 RepID=A0A3N5AB49_9THEO|nr:hypothetical protein [Thermodesulfitimonas autotrophica]RPF42829.1 hypothetical protein EDD75_1941 [Thermodesulfitimonas autotrophica]